MIIVGCDFHPSFQQIAMLDTETGATEEHKLMHTSGEAESIYRKLASPAIVGIETVGNDQWFVQLLQQLGHEVCVGDAAHIRASYVRKLHGFIMTKLDNKATKQPYPVASLGCSNSPAELAWKDSPH